ncbi:MAG: hypothetical protein QOJ37_212, partial [Pseudonocardiales bacterium]|nr:hypothetical protein [Pseudonocardiales bacterium]
MTPGRLGRALVFGAAVLLTASACTSAGTTGGSGSPSGASTPVTSSDTPTVSTPAPVTSTSTSTPAPTPTKTPSPTATSPVSPTTCTNVSVRVIRGGAERGREIAALQYTNDGSASCDIGGFPTVTLLLHGAAIGARSQPSGRAAKTLTVKPSETVESLLSDYSTCQAPLSDNVRVTVPGKSTAVVRPIQLRACTLRV